MRVLNADTMYYLPPVRNQPKRLLLPQCMYELPVVAMNIESEEEPIFTSRRTRCKAHGTPEACRDATKDARLQLSARQETVLERLQGLQLQLNQLKSGQPQSGVQQSSQFQQSGICHDLVIRASPRYPPYSVLVLASALRDAGCSVLTTSLLHSSLPQSAVPTKLQESFKSSSVSGGGRADHQIVVSVVWSDVAVPCLMVSPLHQCPIIGEANIIRYLCRLLPATSPFHYEADVSFAAIAATDQILDSCSVALTLRADRMKDSFGFILSVEERLQSWQVGTSMFGRCGDVGLWSALRQLSERGAVLTSFVARWLAVHDAVFLAGATQ